MVSLAPVCPSPGPRGHVLGRSPASRGCSSTRPAPCSGTPSHPQYSSEANAPFPSHPTEVWPPAHLAPWEQVAGPLVSGRPLGLGWGGGGQKCAPLTWGGHWRGASEGACHSTPTDHAGRDPCRTTASGRAGTCGESPPHHPAHVPHFGRRDLTGKHTELNVTALGERQTPPGIGSICSNKRGPAPGGFPKKALPRGPAQAPHGPGRDKARLQEVGPGLWGPQPQALPCPKPTWHPTSSLVSSPAPYPGLTGAHGQVLG